MKEKIINLLGIRKKMILSRSEIIKGKTVYTIIEPITEEQEKEINDNERYIKNDNIIKMDNIYVYGEIDFLNEQDVDYIKKFNLINFEGNWIYSNFNYDKGIYTTIDKKAKGIFTIDPILWFKYCHCLIGKPKRVIVYRCNAII